MAVGKRHAQPLALVAAAVGAGHPGVGPRLVDDDQASGIEIELSIEPGLPPREDVRPVLLARVAGVFLCVM